MATVNKILENLTLDDIESVSTHYLLGWRDLEKNYGFRLKGLNRKRMEHGLEPLSDEQSMAYRVDFIHSRYTQAELEAELSDYLMGHKMDAQRWLGIDLFGCHFSGKTCIPVLRQIVGADVFDRISEECRVRKLVDTQLELYGGVGIGGKQAFDKAKATVKSKYGVDNPMHIDFVKEKTVSPFRDELVRKKAGLSRWHMLQEELKSGFLSGDLTSGRMVSSSERLAYYELVSKYGLDDVFYSYGVHPYDARYPFNCDFYIKSEDLFIELNLDYCHGGHWFDSGNSSDVAKRNDMLNSSKKRTRTAVDVWTVSDVKKRECAKASGIRYLVFWDNGVVQHNHERFPRLMDFYKWLTDYKCDYDSFIRDYPGNTY